MIVVDASALLEFLLQTSLGARVEARLFREDDELHAPHLVDVEITQGLRRLIRTGEVSSGRAEEAIADLTDLDLHRHPHLDLLGRVWKLRDNLSAYDAIYVALLPKRWERQSSRAMVRWLTRRDTALGSKLSLESVLAVLNSMRMRSAV